MSAIKGPGALIQALRDSNLLEPAQLDEVARMPDALQLEASVLGESLIKLGWLTRYQVDQVLQGCGAMLRLGPFTILDFLGQGPTGPTFKARHSDRPNPVTIKLIPTALLANKSAAQRFYLEMRHAGQLGHPHLAPVPRIFRVKNVDVIMRDFVEGSTLARIVQESGPLPPARAADHIHQAALGLQYAHDHGLAHRHLKPTNLLVEGPTTLVLDLGLARLLDGSAVPDQPPPAAPVVDAADIWEDVKGLAQVFHFMIAGPQSSVPADLPPALQEILPKVLAQNVEDGFRTVDDLSQALKKACWVPPKPPEPPKQAEPPPIPPPAPAAETKPEAAPPEPARPAEPVSAAASPEPTSLQPAETAPMAEAVSGAVPLAPSQRLRGGMVGLFQKAVHLWETSRALRIAVSVLLAIIWLVGVAGWIFFFIKRK